MLDKHYQFCYTDAQGGALMADLPKLYTATEAGLLADGRKPITMRKLAAASRDGAEPIGVMIGRQWLFTDDDIARVRQIDPLGGRPRLDGKPKAYRADPADARRKRGERKK